MNDDKAFDAVESYLCETEREPSGGWRTVSLVTAMLGIISHGPEFERPTPEARHEAFKAAADELSRRGLDAVALVRYGMSQEVVANLISALIVGLVFGDGSGAEGADVRSWQVALGLEQLHPSAGQPTVEEVAEWFRSTLRPVVPLIYQWVVNASLDELVNLSPPARETLDSLPTGEPADRSLREQYRWAVDHFAKTFYRDWQTESLHYELRWLDGDILPPCPAEFMRDRKVSREEITQEIARRVVYHSGKPDPGESLASEMTRYAEKLLKQSRVREAAAVFEFGVQQRPEDPDVRNNLGFCLIPIEPREALVHLKAAANMGYEPSATNVYNQMCCYVAIGRSRAALNIADSELKKPKPRHVPAILWMRSSDGQWQLFDSEDSYKSIPHFAAEIARNEGWKDQEEFWKKVAQQQIEPPENQETEHSSAPEQSQQQSN